MLLYHRTNRSNAVKILANGFKDGTGTYLTQHTFSGVWLSSEPLDENEGASGNRLLEITVKLSQKKIKQYEFIEKGKPYREYLIPAAVLNRCANIRVIESGHNG